MFQVFNHNNIKEVLSKKPLICFSSELGACGPSGSFFVVFDDKSSYGYSLYPDDCDKELVKEIFEYVPEFKGLVFFSLPKDFKAKRETTIFNMELINLGLGNAADIHKDIYSEKLICKPSLFSELVFDYSGIYPGDMFQLINNHFKN